MSKNNDVMRRRLLPRIIIAWLNLFDLKKNRRRIAARGISMGRKTAFMF
jgi:hypothetical protein